MLAMKRTLTPKDNTFRPVVRCCDQSTILVVDDSSVVQGLYEMYLSDLNYRIIHTKNGWEALETLKTQTPCLIFLDMDMPEMDGETFLRYFSCSAAFKQTSVTIVSSRSREEIGERTLKLALGGYIQKPFGPLALRRLIQSAMQGLI